MKLWLDDVRPAPQGWTWAKTAKEAIELLKIARNVGDKIEAVSLDHDLGADEAEGIFARGSSPECGCLVVSYLTDALPPIHDPIRIHSWNGYEARRMVSNLQHAGYHAFYEPYSAAGARFL